MATVAYPDSRTVPSPRSSPIHRNKHFCQHVALDCAVDGVGLWCGDGCAPIPSLMSARRVASGRHSARRSIPVAVLATGVGMLTSGELCVCVCVAI